MSAKVDHWRDRWAGRTVACLASGPSLTREDCDRVHAAGLPTVVTNTTFRLCPWADVLFGFDARWWREHLSEVSKVFEGERLTCSPVGRALGVPTLHGAQWFTTYHNSGAAAISLAFASGAKRVVLLGYDCQKTGGMTHWHGDHPKTLGNAVSMPRWPHHFKQVARCAQSLGIEVVNCSRETALTCFPRAPLESILS
jgi:hypothetical protein